MLEDEEAERRTRERGGGKMRVEYYWVKDYIRFQTIKFPLQYLCLTNLHQKKNFTYTPPPLPTPPPTH